jgi:hypothetical protein
MSTFTGSELEFLAGLNRSWWKLYRKELSRLRRVEAGASKGAPAAAPDISECGDDPACALRHRNQQDLGTGDVLQRLVELAAGNR